MKLTQEEARLARAALEVAFLKVGSATEMARLLGIAYQATQQWRAKGRAPADRVEEIERLSGVSIAVLRPDLARRAREREALMAARQERAALRQERAALRAA
jgi:DNA-binding transcriptional regulator YdaS (Cro superfamily)